jgi:PKD domain-containing protein
VSPRLLILCIAALLAGPGCIQESKTELKCGERQTFDDGTSIVKVCDYAAPTVALRIYENGSERFPQDNELEIRAGSSLTFDASESIELNSGDQLFFQWSFGDDSTAKGERVEHSYAIGNYSFLLQVTNERRASGYRDLNIRVA